jgi:hypothetical protein
LKKQISVGGLKINFMNPFNLGDEVIELWLVTCGGNDIRADSAEDREWEGEKARF